MEQTYNTDRNAGAFRPNSITSSPVSLRPDRPGIFGKADPSVLREYAQRAQGVDALRSQPNRGTEFALGF